MRGCGWASAMREHRVPALENIRPLLHIETKVIHNLHGVSPCLADMNP
jgi:hypothetical protein